MACICLELLEMRSIRSLLLGGEAGIAAALKQCVAMQHVVKERCVVSQLRLGNGCAVVRMFVHMLCCWLLVVPIVWEGSVRASCLLLHQTMGQLLAEYVCGQAAVRQGH